MNYSPCLNRLTDITDIC